MKKVKFTSRSHPAGAIVGTCLGVISIIIFIVMVVLSAKADGQADIIVGIGALASLLISIVGLVISVRCFMKEDVYFVFPIIGTTINAVTVIGLLSIYAVGVLRG